MAQTYYHDGKKPPGTSWNETRTVLTVTRKAWNSWQETDWWQQFVDQLPLALEKPMKEVNWLAEATPAAPVRLTAGPLTERLYTRWNRSHYAA